MWNDRETFYLSLLLYAATLKVSPRLLAVNRHMPATFIIKDLIRS